MKKTLLIMLCGMVLAGCAAPKNDHDHEAAERLKRLNAMSEKIDADAEKLRKHADSILAEAGERDPQITLQLADKKRVFDCDIRPGDSFTVKLEENATTGFLWNADFDLEFASVIMEHHAAAANNDMVGQPGYCLVTITALRPGTTVVNLAYNRSFEPDKEPVNRATFNLVISE